MKSSLILRVSLFLGYLLLLGSGSIYAAEVFDEELNNLLAKPVITKKTLPDGTIVSTVSVGSSTSDAVSGYITLPDGVKIQFTKSTSAGTTSFLNLSNGSSSVCSGSSCSGNISVSPALQSSFSTISRSVASSNSLTSNSSSGPVKVFVSEMVPGATCWCNINGERQGSANEVCPSDIEVQNRKYECQVERGMTAFENMFREIIKWVIYVTMLLGVLALVGSGILWAWGSESEEYTKKAKTWAISIIIGLAILFTFRYILGFLAPWIFM